MDPVLVRYPVRVADKTRAAEAPGRSVELGTWFECPNRRYRKILFYKRLRLSSCHS